MRTFDPQDPSAFLDYVFDWTAWLGNDTIATYNVTCPDEEIVLENHAHDNGKVTVWISGGSNNKSYIITCSIITADGRVNEKSAVLPVSHT